MADLENEATNLFEEFFNPKPHVRDETADAGRDVNNAEDPNVNKHSFLPSGNALITAVSSHSGDNGILNQTKVREVLSDGGSPMSVSDNVTRNNIENLKKKADSSNNSTSKKIENSAENKDDNDSTNVVQGSNNTEMKSDKKSQVKAKKAISFPKDTFISGYFDPPDPWKNAPTWTTADELVTAYKRSCEIHGTKPIQRVTQQLQGILSPGKREEQFSLKGEKLDQKQCECIEEVLRRVQFKLIDLEASHLDDECAVALFDMIEYYESACQLNISFNKNIQARGWQACSRLVRRTPSLTFLDMRNCDLSERTIPIFGRALKLGCHLTILHMESMNLSGRLLVILVAALKMNETLQELFLADNKLMPTDGAQLENLLRYNHKLSLLDLRNNHLQDPGTSHICDGLMEQTMGHGLHTLVLWNNSINYPAMPALGRALAATESLETLNIGHNSITNEGVHLLKDGLLKTTSLLRLGLQGTKISDEGAVALAEYIADSTILLRIDLRDNDIKTGGLMALSHAMRVNTSVTRIDLDKDPKKESGMKDFAEQQNRLLRDIVTFQQRNVQAALDREEEERARLEEKAKAAAAKKEANSQQSSPSSAEGASFTVIGEDEAKDKDVDTDEDVEKPDEEIEHEKDLATGDSTEDVDKDNDDTDEDDTDNAEEAEESGVKSLPRPRQLFPYTGLHPQESLDSPLPTSNEEPRLITVTAPESCAQTPPRLSASDTGRLRAASAPAPGEMILSPQYIPKQIARKIFSVSRVSEDPSWTHLSTSPTPPSPISGTFDPLHVSSVPLTSLPAFSSSPSSSPSPSSSQLPTSQPMPIPQSALGVSQHSSPCPVTCVSPSTSLLQDLTDETVKHLVSPDVDIDVKSLLAQGVALSCGVQSNSDTKGGAEAAKNIVSESNPAIESTENTEDSETATGAALNSEELFSSSTGVENVNECSESVPEIAPNFSHSDVHSCDTSRSSEVSDITSSVEAIDDLNAAYPGDNSRQESLPEDERVCEEQGLEDSMPFSLEYSSPPREVFCDEDPGELSYATAIVDSLPDSTDARGEISSAEPVGTTSPSTMSGKETAAEENEKMGSVLELDPFVRNPVNGPFSTDSAKPSAAFSHQGAGDEAHLSADAGEKDGLALLSADVSVENSTNLDLKNQNCSSSVTEGEPGSVCLNNSHSPSLLLAENLESATDEAEDLDHRLNASRHPDKNMSSTGAASEVKVVHSESSDSLVKVHPSNGDNFDNDNIDLSLDEEPWFTVGADGNDSDKTREAPKQPDFFTTLSMNGLTQELASALTSLDGTTTCYGDEVEELGKH